MDLFNKLTDETQELADLVDVFKPIMHTLQQDLLFLSERSAMLSSTDAEATSMDQPSLDSSPVKKPKLLIPSLLKLSMSALNSRCATSSTRRSPRTNGKSLPTLFSSD